MKIFNRNISRAWIIIIIILVVTIGYFATKSFFKNPLEGYVLEAAGEGEVLQSVSETGSVKATDNVTLGFKAGGRIQEIRANVGDVVKKGQIIAGVDASQVAFQLKNYQAALDVARAQYDKLINGYTPEDIKIYQDARDSAQQDLNGAYISAVNTLNDTYTKTYNSYTTAIFLRDSYFAVGDQQGIKVQNSIDVISYVLADIKTNLDSADSNSAIDSAISNTIAGLKKVYDSLKIIRDQCDQGIYYTKVSSTDKAAMDTQKTNINTALTNVTGDQQDIVSYKLALQKAENNLTLREAEPRAEDISVYQAQIKQAEANVNLYQSQLADTYLRSPIDGRITDVDAKVGEVVSANEAVVRLLSSNPFQIKVDIYEQDIVNVKIADIAKISLVAFPKQAYEGKVLSIDPGEKIVDNVVYYEVTIDFPLQPEGVKSGMTADIVIETNKKENVLRISKNAVQDIDNKDIVQVAARGKIESREITTGLEGNDFVEVVSGLQAGDLIVLGKK